MVISRDVTREECYKDNACASDYKVFNIIWHIPGERKDKRVLFD